MEALAVPWKDDLASRLVAARANHDDCLHILAEIRQVSHKASKHTWWYKKTLTQ